MRAGDLFTRAAEEIGLCRALVSKVEHAVEHLHDAGSFSDLQGIDLLHQTLDDIATLLHALAGTHPLATFALEDAEPLLAPLRLGAVRARLRNADTATLVHDHQHVELF